MRFPPEVRNLIYELCLPINKDFVLWPTPCDTEDIEDGCLHVAPSPALLRVSSTIRAEATAIFYRQNIWRIMDVPKGLSLPTLFEQHVRKATLTFDRRIVEIGDLWDISNSAFSSEVCAKDRLQETHDNLRTHLSDIWMDKCRTLINFHQLRELTVDFSHCMCPLGCCRMVSDILYELTESASLRGDNKIMATGVKFTQEAQMLHEHDHRCQYCFMGPEEDALSAGYCMESLPDDPDWDN